MSDGCAFVLSCLPSPPLLAQRHTHMNIQRDSQSASLIYPCDVRTRRRQITVYHTGARASSACAPASATGPWRRSALDRRPTKTFSGYGARGHIGSLMSGILAAARQKTPSWNSSRWNRTRNTGDARTGERGTRDCSAKYTPQDLKSVRTVIAVRGDGGPQRLLILRPHDLIGTAGTRSRLEISPRDLARSKRLRSDLALVSCLDALGCPRDEAH